MGNFFHLSASFCAALALVSRWHFEDNRSSGVITGGALCRLPRATVTTWRSRVRLSRIFRRDRGTKCPGTRGSPSRGSVDGREKERSRGVVGDKKRKKEGETLEIPRHMLDGTSSLPSGRSRGTSPPSPAAHPPSPPILPHSAAVAEKFKFTHRLPRVCFSNL